ncbi:MAG: hypothetical protein K9H61_03075 [Bacteroidia bacterium]|nr:hypothetical protein [Bacteroidia bacterium]MCF8445955.1 hypothetical protein [Bacteroidia bacterium]
MKYLLSLTLTFFISLSLFAQKNAEEQAIVDEGKMLFKSEMASWNATDILQEKYSELLEGVGGYFSYPVGERELCVFFSKENTPNVILEISFDSSFSVKKAEIKKVYRGFTPFENDMYAIRKVALKLINSDTFFLKYENTALNLIPLIEGESRKVFVLTGPRQNGVVIFGNDYLIQFDTSNQILSKKRLHKNIIPNEYSSNKKKGKGTEVGGVHMHLPGTGVYITSTDICTLMLYQKRAGWKSYMVMSEKYMNIWTCESNSLAVVPRGMKFNKEE